MAAKTVSDILIKKYMDDYTFIRLTPEFINRMGIGFMKGVPVPVKKQALGAFATDSPIKTENFVMAMVMVMGMDPTFKYAGVYRSFLKVLNSDIFDAVMTVGVNFANAGNLEMATIHFRAACGLKEESLAALYNYMMACRTLYQDEEQKDDYKEAFKVETNLALVTMTSKHPDFAMGFYYMGFSFLNAGKYAEAQKAWEAFMEKSGSKEPPKVDPETGEAKPERFAEERKEIMERLDQLEEPVKIEAGYRAVMSGNISEGMERLEGYIGTDYMNWWPLPYYLGVGYSRSGLYDQAIEMFKRVLKMNPSSPETNGELAEAYRGIGDTENADKYQQKFELLKEYYEQQKKMVEEMDAAMEKQEQAKREELEKMKAGSPVTPIN